MANNTGVSAGPHDRFDTPTIPVTKRHGGDVAVREQEDGCVARGGNGRVKTLTLTDGDALLASTLSATGASAKAGRPSPLSPPTGRLLRMTSEVGGALQGVQARVLRSLLPIVLLVGGVA